MKKYNITEFPVILYYVVCLALFLSALYVNDKYINSKGIFGFSILLFFVIIVWILFYRLIRRKIEVDITDKGINFNYKKKSVLYKSKTQFYEWNIIYHISQTSSWIGPEYLSSDLNIFFTDNVHLTLTRIDLFNKDDFNELCIDLKSNSKRFKKLSQSELPKPVTIYETRWIQITMIFITLFALTIRYHINTQPSGGAFIVLFIYGLGSLYYWYKAIDIWSKKKTSKRQKLE